MAVIRELDDETTLQTIAASDTIYILENGSIVRSAINEALAIGAGLTNVTIQLIGSRIENLGSNIGSDSILSESSIRVELSDDSVIRAAAGSAIQTNTAGAGIDLVNHGSITNTGATSSTIAGGNGAGRVVNFGLIKGATTSAGVINLGANSTLDNFGLIDAGTVTNVAVVVGTGNNFITNAGFIFGMLAFLNGNDTLNNSGVIQGLVDLSGGADVFNNNGAVIGNINLGVGDDTYDGLGGSYSGTVLGGVGNDRMFGNTADDSFSGGLNDDTLVGRGGDDFLSGDGGIDELIGGAGNDTLLGDTEDDTLDGGTGADFLAGGTGVDTARYLSSVTAVRVSLADSSLNTGEAAGDAFSSVENLLGSAFNDRLIGDAGANNLNGSDGNDVLEGGAGVDTLLGEIGNDTLNGGLGADSMTGGFGNDTYFVDIASDQITEAAGQGIDTVFATTSFTLGVGDEIEFIHVSGVTGRTVNGNEFGQQIFGNNGNDALRGLGGNDFLIGGLGRDVMTGGADDDVFRYTSIAQSKIALPDIVTDFDDAGNDKIDISLLRGPAFVYRHNLAFTAAGQVRINDIAGADVIVEVNTGGTLAADFAIRLTGTTLASMTASDFIL